VKSIAAGDPERPTQTAGSNQPQQVMNSFAIGAYIRRSLVVSPGDIAVSEALSLTAPTYLRFSEKDETPTTKSATASLR